VGLISDLVVLAADRAHDRLHMWGWHGWRPRAAVTLAGFRRRLWGALLLLPGLTFLAVFFVYPILGVARRSFDPAGRLHYFSTNLTLANYADIFQDTAYRLILRNTFIIAIEATIISVLLAYPVAFFLTRLPRRWGQPLLLLALFPFWTSILIRLYAFTQVLDFVHLLYTTPGTVIGMVHYLLPYMIAVLYATMITIDTELLRAARSLGASEAKGMRYIFFPLTRTGLFAGCLFIFVIGLGFYLTPAILGAASDVTIAIYIQEEVNIYKWGVAGAMGVMLLLITLGVFIILDRTLRFERVVGVGGGGQKGAASSAGVGWSWTMVGLAVYTGLTFLFLLGPLVVVVLVSFTPSTFLDFPPRGFSLRWYRDFFSDPTWLTSAWLSLRVALLTVVTATTLGLAAAYALERSTIVGKRFFRALFITPLIVPVILIAASLFDLEARLQLSATIPGYVVGHTILALPFTVVLLSTALSNLGVELEEASRTLGANRWRTFYRVTLPAIAPSVGAAGIFAFVTSWDEAVVSLFLSSVQTTLPVHMFSFLRVQLRPTIAAISTILMAAVVLISILVLVLSNTRRRRRGGSFAS
jgi:putative spermidine/putrescine transport system permease protein